MTEIEIELPEILLADAVIPAVESVASDASLQVTMKGTLKKFPGCVHWHFKRKDNPGILEITWWFNEDEKSSPRLWFTVHNNRKADWMLKLMPVLKKKLEAKLTSKHPF